MACNCNIEELHERIVKDSEEILKQLWFVKIL